LNFRRVLNDDSYYKVVVYGIRTEDFNTKGGLQAIRQDLETYNQGLKLTSDPIWLTSPTKRGEQHGASILITFRSKAEASEAIRYRLFIGGVSLRAEHAKDKSKANSQGDLC